MLIIEPGPRFVPDDSRNTSFSITGQEISLYSEKRVVPKTLPKNSGYRRIVITAKNTAMVPGSSSGSN